MNKRLIQSSLSDKTICPQIIYSGAQIAEELVRAGRKPDNFLAPSDLADFERSHLRDAFVVVRTMQSALGQGRGVL